MGFEEGVPVPITVSTQVSSAGGDSPTVCLDLVIHLPEEIVAAAVAAERVETPLIVCCREADQARALSQQLLIAGVGSAVITGRTPIAELGRTLEAFALADFTVLLATDDLTTPWAAPTACTLLHADLPSLFSGPLLNVALRVRLSHVETVAEPLLVRLARSRQAC